MAPLVRLLRLRGLPILQQLRLEEALLRADAGNWCILNDGSATPAVVLGISGCARGPGGYRTLRTLLPLYTRVTRALPCRKPGELVHEAAAAAAGVPLIKRFSGGGTVVVDADTLFATLILNASALPDVECYPRPIMRWSERFYQPVFAPYGDFSLREHGLPLCCMSPQCAGPGGARTLNGSLAGVQTMPSESASLAATHRRSPRRAGCTTPRCYGTLATRACAC